MANIMFKDWLVLEEVFPNKTATAYHRTKSLDNIQGVLSSGFKKTAPETWAGNCLYGCGLYTTFDINSQFSDYMKIYGNYLIKFKVTNLANYLIFQKQVAKHILGSEYKISTQLKRLTTKKFNQEELERLDKQQENAIYSSEVFKEFYDKNRWIESELTGGIYRGQNDGYSLLKYYPIDQSITMIAYAHAPVELSANDIQWITSSKHMRIKDTYRSKPSQKRSDQSILEPDRASYENLIYASKNNLFDFIIKILKQTSDWPPHIISQMINSSPQKKKLIKLITTYKKHFSASDIESILTNSFYLEPTFFEEVIIKLGKNINVVEIENFSEFLKNLSEEEKKLFLTRIIQNKKEFSQREFNIVLSHSQEKEVINLIASRIGVSQIIRYIVPDLIDNFLSKTKENFFKSINVIKTLLKTPEALEDKEYFVDYLTKRLASAGFQDTYAVMDYIK